MTVVAPDPAPDHSPHPGAGGQGAEPTAGTSPGTGAELEPTDLEPSGLLDNASADPEVDPGVGPSTTSTSTSTSSRGHLPYFPALDGLRGLAVGAVLLFHGGFSWMTGGFLGVSTFFTLSGFLITSLLLAERGANASIDLRRFWRRRFRRLMPAALGALVLAMVYSVLAGDAIQKRNLAGDVVASLAYVANWRFILSNQSYADLFGAPSPVLHFWSLAIEEQFYLLFPLLAYAVLQFYRKSRQYFGAVLVVLAGVSVGLSVLWTLNRDAVYYGTETRAAELLVGGVLAVGLYHRRVTTRLARDARVRNAVALAGGLALLGVIALWSVTTSSAPWLYQGGFAVYAVLSAAVILACIIPSGPVRLVLAVAPLRSLGLISYGVYLYHWPIFLWLNEDRTGLNPYVLFVPRVAATLVLAGLSYRFLEMPVRRGQPLFRIRPVRLAPYAIALIAAGVIAISITAPKPIIDFDSAAAQLEAAGSNGPPPPPAPDLAAPEPPFPRMAIFGDSTALMTGLGMSAWARDSKQADFVDGAAWLGCGIGRGGERRSGSEAGAIPEQCNRWERTWGQKVKDNRPNIAVVQIGPWEVADRKLAGDKVWRYPGDPIYDAYLLKEMVLAVDTLSENGADVMWLTSPPVGAGKGKDAQQIRGQGADPARMAALNALINKLPTERPGKVQVIDLAGWLISTGEDERLRPDGVHFGAIEGKEASQRFLGPTIIDAFKRDWVKRHELELDIRKRGSSAPNAIGTVPGGSGTSTTAPPGSSVPTNPGGEPSTTNYLGPKRKVLVFGDSAAQPIADGLKAWGDKANALEVTAVVSPNCGIVKTSSRVNKGTAETTPNECENLVYGWLQAVVAAKPDMIVIVPSVWDLTDNQLVGDAQMRSLGDKDYETELRKQYSAIVDAMKKNKTPVMWLNSPQIEWGRSDQPPPAQPYAASHPNRVDRLNQLLLELAITTAYVQRVDYAAFAKRWPGGQFDNSFRPDGLTVGPDAVAKVGEWSGNEILVIYDEFLATSNR